jgi:type 1 fimbriae regulatory protein FimE
MPSAAASGTPNVHPMQGMKFAPCGGLQREPPAGPHVFNSEGARPMATKSVHTLLQRLGARATFPIHPHVLWHACGYVLANAGHDTRTIQSWFG